MGICSERGLGEGWLDRASGLNQEELFCSQRGNGHLRGIPGFVIPCSSGKTTTGVGLSWKLLNLRVRKRKE